MKGLSVGSSMVSLLSLLSSASLFAQEPVSQPPVATSQPPVVTVLATDPNAAEDGPDPGTFEVSRTGDTTKPLTVYYSLGGNSKNGHDFKMLPGWVTFDAGAAIADITVTPILDVDPQDQNPETVVLQLHPLVDFPHGQSAPYALGWPSNAVVTIAESKVTPTNRPPSVEIVSPAKGAGFVTPVDIQFVAQARDADGAVKTVEFLAATSTGTNSIGVVSNTLSGRPYNNLFALVWTNVPAGNYSITAKATDDQGSSTVSAPVAIQVLSAANLPVVTVLASTPNASELGPVPGTFTVSRTGDTSGPLAVYYSLDGTAQNGIDYQRLSGVVNFAAGAPTTNITVTPIPDLDPVAQTSDTVVLQLRSLVNMHPGLQGLYTVGSPSNAVVTITEDASAFPVVTAQATDPNASEDGPDTGTFQITRTGNTGGPLTVYYFLGGTARNGRDYQMLPSFVTIPAGAPGTNITVTPIWDKDTTPETNETVVLQLVPRLDLFSDVVGGLADRYAIGFPSNAVVTIAESTKPPPNQPPLVRLVSPGDGAGFVAPATLQILAQASDPDGTVTNVQFFAATSTGTNKIGTVTSKLSNGRYHGYYSMIWSNVDVGNYTLTAVATDDQGAGATSGPVHISVTKTALPKVSISAVDPIAFISPTGTNSASFTVRRTDGTNADLVVYYTLSGTASNGVDYVKLPGSITIPAGRFTAAVTVTPLPDAAITGRRQQTVTLAIQAPPVSDSNPPTYALGKPQQATALILDRGARRQDSGWLDNGMFQVVMPASQTTSYQLQVSTNLVDWEVVGASSASQNSVQFVDPDAANSPTRFYRTVPDPSSNSD